MMNRKDMNQPEEGLFQRSTRAVFDDHLRLRNEKRTEEDIERNYSPDVVIMSWLGKFFGREGVRRTASNLEFYFPDGGYHYTNRLVEGEVAFLEWTGKSSKGIVCDGADTFVIRNGQIVCQTIHYNLEEKTSGQ